MLFVWLIYDCIKDFSTVTVIIISMSILSKNNVLTLWVVLDILHKLCNMYFSSPLNMIARWYFITGKRYSLNRLFCVYKSFMIEPKKIHWFYDFLQNFCNPKNKHIFSTSSCLNILFCCSISLYQRFLQYCAHNVVTPCICMESMQMTTFFHILSFLSSYLEEVSISTSLVSSLCRLSLLAFTCIYFTLP